MYLLQVFCVCDLFGDEKPWLNHQFFTPTTWRQISDTWAAFVALAFTVATPKDPSRAADFFGEFHQVLGGQ